MKTQGIHKISFLFILMIGWITARGQQWEVPGDNFSLEGALEIFKESASPEEFERRLNDPDVRVNNLDLNGDGYIDYIRVIDYYEGNVHAFVLQAAISERQGQDIAVITLEKLANGKAILQITGDADIYGVETIIEPTTEVRTYAGTNRSRVIVNVWAWPMVRYVYSPYYTVWVSPWGWRYRPHWWRPWRPVVYYDYYAYWRPYYSHYSICYTHRVVYAHRIYRPYRTTSVIVHKRHHHRIKEYRSARIDRRGYYEPRDSRHRTRRQPNSIRYNSDGRIVSAENSRISSRSSSSSRIDRNRSAVRSENGNNVRRSRDIDRSSSGDYNARQSSGRTNNDTNLRRSGGSSGTQQYNKRSSENSNMRRSSGNSAVRRSETRSNTGSNYRRSDDSQNLQRSSRRSSESSNIQRSQSGSRSSSGYRQSSRSSGSRESYKRSSGNSGSRSAIRSSSSRKSSGSRSGVQRSPQRSSSGTSGSRSSGSSNSSSRGRR